MAETTCPDTESTGTTSTEEEETTTYCDLDRTNNVWVEGVVDVENGKLGICMLDQMSYEQIVYVLQHDPRARRDLPKFTSDPELLALLDTIPLLGTTLESDQKTRASARTGLPYYTQFQGRPPIPRK